MRNTDTWQSPNNMWRRDPGTPLIAIADSDDPRVGFLRNAMADHELDPPVVVPYRELINQPQILHSQLRTGALIRIESPGRDSNVQMGILNRGYEVALKEGSHATSPLDVTGLHSSKGLIVNTRQWYLGFCSVLKDIGTIASKTKSVGFTSSPADIRIMFDKSKCHGLLQSAELPVPEGLGIPECYEDLLRKMKSTGCNRVFAKLRHGSAASGVVALETNNKKIQAWTTVEIEKKSSDINLFNTRRIRRLNSEHEICDLINSLCKQSLHVERWVPKAGIAGKCFDLRILVIAGQPAHTVVRMSKSPITNLHLRNNRTTLGSVRDRIDRNCWDNLLCTCERVGRLFKNNLLVALDLAVSPCGRRHWILEVNAFGDLLRDCFHNDMNPYELQVATLFGPKRKAHNVQSCSV